MQNKHEVYLTHAKVMWEYGDSGMRLVAAFDSVRIHHHPALTIIERSNSSSRRISGALYLQVTEDVYE